MLVCLCGFRGGGPDSRTNYSLRLDTEIENGQNREWRSYIGKGTGASFEIAHERLFTRVRSRVDGQGTSLDEALVAAFHATAIWTLICVDAVVSAEVGVAME